MASLLSFAKRVGRQLDPFDGGATASHPAAPPPQVPNDVRQKIMNGPYNHLSPQQKTQLLTPTPKFNPLKAAIPAFGEAAQKIVVQPVARTLPEIAASVTNRPIRPTNKISKALLGTQPVNPVQQDVRGVYRSVKAGHQNLPGGVPISPGLATPYAIADALFHIGQDVPVAGAVGKGAKVLTEGSGAIRPALSVLKPLDQVGGGKIADSPIRKVIQAEGKVPAVAKVARKSAGSSAKPTIPKPAISALTPPKISQVDVAGRSTTGVLNKIDPRLAELVTRRRELGETNAALAKTKLKITNSLSTDEQQNLARVLKGTEKPVNDTVAAAAKETKGVLDTAYYRAKNTGVPVKAYRKNYYPQILNPKTFAEGSRRSDTAIQHLIQTGQAENEADAIGKLRVMKQSRSPGPYGNLSKSRSLDLPGYAENNAAIHTYLDKAYATIAHTKVMGRNDKILNKVLADVKKNGGDYEQAIKSYRQASGLERGSDRGQKISRAITNIQGSTKLGLSSIGNLTQQSNNVIAGGGMRTLKALLTQGTEANKAFLAKTGVKDEQVAHEALFGEQGISRFRNITAPGFEQVEKSNRATAGLVGRDLANSLAKKAAAGDHGAGDRLLREFGITAPKKGVLSEADQIKAARNMSERTQFRTGPQDLPGWTSTPTGRVVSQFKRYPYKQVGFLKKEVLDEARRGNLAPAARLAVVGAPIGVGAGAVSDKIRGVNFKQGLPEEALNLLNDATGSSLLTSLAQGLYPNSYDANSYISKAVKTLGGPTTSDAIKAVQGGFEAAKGKPTNAERFGLSHVPIVGTPASSRLLPYANTGASAGDANANKPTGDPTKDKANSDAQLKAIKAKPPKGYGLSQLPDGRYVYSLNGTVKTSKNLKAASDAIRKDAFSKTSDSYKVIPNVAGGGVVLRRGADGTITETSKTKFDYQLGTATLTAQKNSGDVTGWLKTANSQLDSIAKQLQDPSIDPLEAVQLQNDATTLQKNIDKYGGYGGFTKGSSGKKTPFVTTGFKTAAGSKAPKITGVKVKKLASAPLKTRKLSVSKIPKIA